MNKELLTIEEASSTYQLATDNCGLRKGYKQTEVGVIPEDWSVGELGNLSVFITSGSRGWARYYSDSGALFVRSQNVRKGRLDLSDSQFVNPPQGSEGSRTQVQHSDLLITITGNSVGNVALVDQDLGEAYISQHVGLVRLREPSYGQYVCRFLSPGSPYNRQISASQSGQSKPGLTLRNLQNFWVALPPLLEQQSIAKTLNNVDALLDSLDQLITKKRDLKQAAMQQLLTGQTRLPGFSCAWTIKPLGDVVSIQKGQLITEKDAVSADIPVIAGGKTPAYFHNKPNRTGKTITISASGASAGYVAFFDTPIFASDCSTISDSQLYSIEFFYYQLQLKQEVIYNAQTGGAQPHIHAVDLIPLQIGCPSLFEQTAIAIVLSDMDTEISALEARRDKTKDLKQGMMQELLTGRIRLI